MLMIFVFHTNQLLTLNTQNKRTIKEMVNDGIPIQMENHNGEVWHITSERHKNKVDGKVGTIDTLNTETTS